MLPELGVDAIISTGPPHSVHLIARKLRKKFNMPWLADFRDPWSEIDYLERFRLTKPAWWLQKKLEKKVLYEADEVVTVSPSWADDLERIGNRKVRVITNGFDRADFEGSEGSLEDKKDSGFQDGSEKSKASSPGSESVESSKSSELFRLTYAGFMNSLRNPVQLWQALDELCQEKPEVKDKLELKIIGTIDEDVKNHIRQYPNLSGRIHFQAYTPHNQLLDEYKNSSVLLLIQTQSKNSKGHIPGKFFEYLASLRPILMIGSVESDMAQFLEKLKAGKTNNYQEKEAIKQSLVGLFEQHQSRNVQSDANEIEAYNRENLTKQLSELLNKQLSPSQNIK
jgi:glycosyltransferase involved in cell wall biosynthesis